MYKLVGLVVTTSCIWWCFCMCVDVEGKVVCCVAQENPQLRELIPSFLMLDLLQQTNLKDKCQSYQPKIDSFQEKISIAITGIYQDVTKIFDNHLINQ